MANGTFINSSETVLRMVDGGEDGEVIPAQPLLVKAREVDVMVVIDAVRVKYHVAWRVTDDFCVAVVWECDRLVGRPRDDRCRKSHNPLPICIFIPPTSIYDFRFCHGQPHDPANILWVQHRPFCSFDNTYSKWWPATRRSRTAVDQLVNLSAIGRSRCHPTYPGSGLGNCHPG